MDAPTASSKHHRPYFTPEEVRFLSDKQRSKGVSEDRAACAFLEAVGAALGFPRRTIATALNLHHRFYLFFARKDFTYVHVALASLCVSTKMHDTLKKPRELLAVAYELKPELGKKAEKRNGEIDMDHPAAEADRQRLLAIERLIIENICFNFTSRMPFPYVVKLGRAFSAPKTLTKLAWRLASDSHRTLVPIQYPPHAIALGALYTAALLTSFEAPSPSPSSPAAELAAQLSRPGAWEARYQVRVGDLDEIAHAILDLLMQTADASSHSASTSPATPSSPSPYAPYPSHHPSHTHAHPQAPVVHSPWPADQLMRLKIAMRERFAGSGAEGGGGKAGGGGRGVRDAAALLAMRAASAQEGTVRFLFGPPSIVGDGV